VKHGRIARAFRTALWALLVLAVVVAGLQTLDKGRALTVRSYVRAERLWSRDFPIASARGLVRRVEPVLARIGLLRPVRVEVEPGVSLLLDPADDISRTILVSRAGRWEPEVWRSISSALADGGVFFDVGAHIGYDSLKAARVVGENGRVVAFEPNPNTLALLRSNIDASRARNVVVQPIACTDVETTLTLFDSTLGGNSGSSSLSRENAGPVARPYTVRGRPIDDVVKELAIERLDVLKADVEGAELIVLRGATETLRRFHPKLILEVVPRQLASMGTSVEELEAFVRSLGYTTVKTVDYKNKEYSYFVGTSRFNSSTQCCTTTMLAGAEVPAAPPSLIIRNRWPSGETSYDRPHQFRFVKYPSFTSSIGVEGAHDGRRSTSTPMSAPAGET
jgi:FkbM family methyltransferase